MIMLVSQKQLLCQIIWGEDGIGMSKIAVFFAEGYEEIEALTVVDLTRRAGIETWMVSITEEREVTGSHGISVSMDKVLKEVEKHDGLEQMLSDRNIHKVAIIEQNMKPKTADILNKGFNVDTNKFA